MADEAGRWRNFDRSLKDLRHCYSMFYPSRLFGRQTHEYDETTKTSGRLGYYIWRHTSHPFLSLTSLNLSSSFFVIRSNFLNRIQDPRTRYVRKCVCRLEFFDLIFSSFYIFLFVFSPFETRWILQTGPRNHGFGLNAFLVRRKTRKIGCKIAEYCGEIFWTFFSRANILFGV